MNRRNGNRLLACLLALAMLFTNVDAVRAAGADTNRENGGVQTVTLPEAAPEALSEVSAKEKPAAEYAEEESSDPETDVDGEDAADTAVFAFP